MAEAEIEPASFILAMPEADLDEWMSRAIQTRRLSGIVRKLNRNALRPVGPASREARRALSRLGFPD